MTRTSFASLLSIAGYLIIGFYAGWMPALGVFIAIWGNNLQQSVRADK